MATFVFRSVLPATPAEVFAFHERPEAFRLLTPWWSGARVVAAAPNLRPGARAIIRLGPPVVGVNWVAEHTRYDPPREFVEHQVSGPFRTWEHHHRILPHPHGAVLSDEVTYALGGGPIGRVVEALLLRPFFVLLFSYRHSVTYTALAGGGRGRAT
ncbi:MAG: hypothetical protein NVSMB65_05790 [Chloroflexota bacterium]